MGGVTEVAPERLAALSKEYGLEVDPDSVPGLLERFGLTFPGERLPGGWTPTVTR